ncbi:MAG: phenylalanine--tRNA ligase subunit beta [Nocardioidaceae bacterium]
MRVPVSWLRDYVDLPADVDVPELASRLTALGLKLEALESHGADVVGPLVVGRVLSFEAETHTNGKTVRWCQVDVGAVLSDAGAPRGIVCGADNFDAGDLVVVSLPGAVLPGGFAIGARRTYGHVSDGMICSPRELRLGDDHGGIMVLGPDDASPGDDAAELLHLRDDVIEFEINPDRAYALSVRGVARDTAIAYSTAFHDPAGIDLDTGSEPAYPVRVEDPAGCPLFVARRVSGFDPTRPTPRWLARRVQLAGMRPISLAVDVTNYVMLEMGQPIHGYDGAALRGPVVVRRAQTGEKLTTLDGAVRTLDAEDLLITDDSGPIGLAGVMGGEHTELGPQTTDVVIEAAGFDAVSVARTARRHKLMSEASKRFERGVDPTIPWAAAQRVAELLVEHGGGWVEPGVTAVGAPSATATISMVSRLPQQVSGVEIDAVTAVSALRVVGCAVEESDPLTVVPPPWRPDLRDPNDLVEEVLRVVGYDKVPSVLPVAPAGRGLTARQRNRRRIGLAAAGAGLVQVTTSPFVGAADWDRLSLPPDDDRRRALRIQNPLSELQPHLTTTLLPGLLATAARNVSRGAESLAIFETAPVFLPGTERPAAPIPGVLARPSDAQLAALDRALPDQPLHLAAVLLGERHASGWWGDGRRVAWGDAVAVAREVGRVLSVDVAVEAATLAPWHPGRCAALRVGGEVVGHAGELHPAVSAAWDLPPRACAVELSLEPLFASAVEVVVAPGFSTYPVAKEDVALVVDSGVPAQTVADTLRSGAGPLCESVRLFDVYTGNPVPPGHKSLAFALRFRAPDRTLTEADTARARDAAVAAAVARGATPRT